MQVAIDLTNDFVAFQTATSIRQEMQASYALWLFQRERVTLAVAEETGLLASADAFIAA